MLFCLARAVQLVFATLIKHGWAYKAKYGEVAVMCAGMSVLMAVDRQDFTPLFKGVLGYLFGPQPWSGKHSSNGEAASAAAL